MDNRPAVVTIAALFGAGGDVIGPRVAERLGVSFLDRAIPASVARRTGVPEEIIAVADQRPRSGKERFIATFARASTLTLNAPGQRLDLDDRDIRAEIEEFLVVATRSGGVVLGRGAMVVLRSVPGALHVFLRGPREARIERVMTKDGVNREVAERRTDANDRARIDYVKTAYGVDGRDPSLYHLVLDATALGDDTCIELIVAASRAKDRKEGHGSGASG